MEIGPIVRAMAHNKVRVTLIVLEIAITLAIVSNCVNMILQQREQMTIKSGFDDENLVSVSADAFAKEYEDQKWVDALIDRDIRVLESIPGVRSATNTYFLPWIGGGSSFDVSAPGKPGQYKTQTYPATDHIFETLGVKIIEGRGFQPNDYDFPADGRPNAYIISSGLAKLIFGNQSAVGKVLTSVDGKRTYPIVGVIDNFYNPYSWPIFEYVVFSPRRSGGSGGMTYLIRTQPGAIKSVSPLIESRLLANNRGRVISLRTIPATKDQFQSGSRLTLVAMSSVIVVLTFVTALGIVGITSLSVAERTRQIGTRRALGATRSAIVLHFLTENWLVTTAGLALGALSAYGLNIALLGSVSDAKLGWPLVASGMVLLWVTGIVATLPPALRAASISPAIATRSV